jgi:hypothetical protein
MHSQHILRLLLPAIWLMAFLPAGAGVAVINGLTHEVTLAPGETTRGKIEIQNTSATATAVKLTQSDYWYSHLGESRYDAPGTNPRSNTSWVTLSSFYVTLGPHETKTVEFEMAAPSSDTLSGTYWSVVLVEGMAPPDTTSSRKGVSISTVTRYAVQIIAHIGETGLRDLRFDHLTLARDHDTPSLHVDISNPGSRSLRPEVALELFDAGGRSLGVIKADRKRIYPGTSARFTLILPSAEPGRYTGVLVADCDEDHIFGTNVNLDL